MHRVLLFLDGSICPGAPVHITIAVPPTLYGGSAPHGSFHRFTFGLTFLNCLWFVNFLALSLSCQPVTLFHEPTVDVFTQPGQGRSITRLAVVSMCAFGFRLGFGHVRTSFSFAVPLRACAVADIGCGIQPDLTRSAARRRTGHIATCFWRWCGGRSCSRCWCRFSWRNGRSWLLCRHCGCVRIPVLYALMARQAPFFTAAVEYVPSLRIPVEPAGAPAGACATQS